MFIRMISTAAAIISVASFAQAAQMVDGKIMANEVISGTALTFEVDGWPKDANGVMIIVEGPKDYYAEDEFGGAVPKIYLSKYGDVADGYYSYEIRGATGEVVKKTEMLDNGRDGKESDVEFLTFVLSGTVLVKGGVIVKYKQDPEVGSEKPITGETDPDTDTGGKPKVGDGEGSNAKSGDGDKG